MKSKILAVCLVFIASLAFAQKNANFKIDPSRSIVKWAGKKIVGGQTEGTITVASGWLELASNQLKGAEIIMDTKSIQSDKAPKRLIDHLKNEDFFDVEKFPTAKFVVEKVQQVKGQSMVSGRITIKGITKAISFPAEITKGKDLVVAKASNVKVDRTQFGVQYKSGSIFSGLGDGAIEDNFILDITLTAVKK